MAQETSLGLIQKKPNLIINKLIELSETLAATIEEKKEYQSGVEVLRDMAKLLLPNQEKELRDIEHKTQKQLEIIEKLGAQPGPVAKKEIDKTIKECHIIQKQIEHLLTTTEADKIFDPIFNVLLTASCTEIDAALDNHLIDFGQAAIPAPANFTPEAKKAWEEMSKRVKEEIEKFMVEYANPNNFSRLRHIRPEDYLTEQLKQDRVLREHLEGLKIYLKEQVTKKIELQKELLLGNLANEKMAAAAKVRDFKHAISQTEATISKASLAALFGKLTTLQTNLATYKESWFKITVVALVDAGLSVLGLTKLRTKLDAKKQATEAKIARLIKEIVETYQLSYGVTSIENIEQIKAKAKQLGIQVKSHDTMNLLQHDGTKQDTWLLEVQIRITEGQIKDQNRTIKEIQGKLENMTDKIPKEQWDQTQQELTQEQQTLEELNKQLERAQEELARRRQEIQQQLKVGQRLESQ